MSKAVTQRCRRCEASGQVLTKRRTRDGGLEFKVVTCPDCRGKGATGPKINLLGVVERLAGREPTAPAAPAELHPVSREYLERIGAQKKPYGETGLPVAVQHDLVERGLIVYSMRRSRLTSGYVLTPAGREALGSSRVSE